MWTILQNLYSNCTLKNTRRQIFVSDTTQNKKLQKLIVGVAVYSKEASNPLFAIVSIENNITIRQYI